MPLTDAAIKKVTAPTNGKRVRLHDHGGLYLEISPTGGKWWRFKYSFEGKEKRFSLGVYPDVNLKEARLKRDEARILLSKGIDPLEKKRGSTSRDEPNECDSFEKVAMEWHGRFSQNWASTHAVKILSRLKKNVFPHVGERSIRTLRATDMLPLLRRMEERGVLEGAHRVANICSQIFRYAVATGRAERDCMHDLRGALPPWRDNHYPTILDPEQIGQMLVTFDGYDGNFETVCALKLAPLVFVRPGELRNAKWADINLEEAEWRYISSKTKQLHLVPLAHQAVAILNQLKKHRRPGDYVFPGHVSIKRPISENTINAALRRMGYSKEEFTGHGFRAMARTLLDEVLGFPAHLIEHQLAHMVRDPLGRAYNRTTHLPQRREMMQAWADYLDDLKTKAQKNPAQ